MAVRLIVRGRVQGVFFRDWTVRTACGLGLEGWVRNGADGTVEIHAQGPADAIDALAAAARTGPPAAEVSEVTRSETTDEALAGFERR